MKEVTLAILSALLVSGCTSVEFSKTGDFSSEPKQENCEFTVYTTRPEVSFKEIGVVDLVGGAASLPKTVKETRELVGPEVCKNGGNGLLLWEANGFGGYTKGTVVYLVR